MGTEHFDSRIARLIVEKDEVLYPYRLMMLEECIDVQSTVAHHTDSDKLILRVVDVSRAIQVPDFERKDLSSDGEFNEFRPW